MPDKLKNQHKITIDDIEICFPMKPYQCQLDYMAKVVEACKKGQNALLESPTGTGKTLCLLTAALAWLKQFRATTIVEDHEMPRIIYCSRTHS